MSFLVVMRPARPDVQDEHELLQQHWAYPHELKASGLLTPEIRPLWIVTR